MRIRQFPQWAGFLGSMALILASAHAQEQSTAQLTPETNVETSNADKIHLQELERANASVKAAAPLAQADPLRPAFHITAEANWINDPNGPIYHDGEYHLFFQHNPYGDAWGNMSWGHVVSEDLVHWKHLPIALTPTPGSYDKDGIFSGCCVINDGVPTIIYTGVEDGVQRQCIATSRDGMRTWTKHPANPVIDAPPVENTTGFRDPYVWEQDGVWYMALGTGIRDQGGAAFLYRSEDLVSWEYLHLLDSGFGNMWECPNFFPIEDKHVLVVAPYNILRYAVGSYKNDRFERESPWRLLCLSDNRGFYASHTQLDAQGRRIVWGWITGPGSTGHPWNGMIALPRVVTLSKDNRLSVAPLPELAQLRGGHVAFSDILIEKDSPYVLEGVSGDAIEIDLTFDIGASQSVGLDVLCSPDGEEKTRIVFDNYALTLAAGDQKGPFQLAPGETKMRLQVYVDRSVVEVFANGRENIICRTYPARTDSKQVRLFSSGDRSKVPQVDVWQLGSIWKP